MSLPLVVQAGSVKEAKISSTAGEVSLAGANGDNRKVSLNDSFARGTTITTAADSRAELTFNNGAVARLSVNSVLNFKGDLELAQGAVLIDVPGGNKAKIRAADIAVDVAGATALLEHQAPAFKFLVLEGTVRLYRPAHLGDSILIRSGQMVFGSTKSALADPVDFEIERFVKTCPLIQKFAPLRDEKLVAEASNRQERQKSKKGLVDTNLVIFGAGSTVSVVDSGKGATPASNVSPAGSGQASVNAQADHRLEADATSKP